MGSAYGKGENPERKMLSRCRSANDGTLSARAFAEQVADQIGPARGEVENVTSDDGAVVKTVVRRRKKPAQPEAGCKR